MVTYTLRFPDLPSHYVEVEAEFPACGELWMPVWTPGSYMVREYSRHVEDVRAFDADGAELGVAKSRKNRWRVAGGGCVRVQYRVYCHDMTVRTNWVDEQFAFLSAAATFLAPVDDGKQLYEVRLELPDGWHGAPTMPMDYDALIDSPVLVGRALLHKFEVDGVPHALIQQGDDSLWDNGRAVADTRKIVELTREMWGGLPYASYKFLNLIVEAGGGLEHKDCCVLMTGRYAMRSRKAYLNWLGLVSHEYFHVWNVKRLRPFELGPFDYENEVYTRGLWVAEGFTEYYGGLNVVRAGLAGEDEYLSSDVWNASLASLIQGLETTPGRHEKPLAEASFDAWIKLYRPDENTANSSISYYVKGAVVAFLLDAKLRRLSGNARSLDDVMRLAYGRYSGARGYTEAEFIACVEEVAAADLGAFFHHVLDTAEDLDYREALDWYGLEFCGGAGGKAWMGIVPRVSDGRCMVSRVPRGSPAFAAGVSVDDEILAIDGYRVLADKVAQRLEVYAPGDRVTLLVARRERILSIDVALGAEPNTDAWRLRLRENASAEQNENRAKWLTLTSATGRSSTSPSTAG